MANKLNNEVFERFERDGYVIIHNYMPEAQRAEMTAAIRRVLKPWDDLKAAPPTARIASRFFPYPEQALNRAIIDHDAIAFSQRWLGTRHLHYRPGLSLALYPGYIGDSGVAHIDNGNNSLLPPTSDRAHSQIVFWFYLDDVGPDQAPTRFIKNADGDDLSKSDSFVAPGGSVAIFHNYTWHAASNYRRGDGQRYVWKFAFGRADHYWEGVSGYTDVGMNPHFREFIVTLSAADRELFRFPPAGHAYYTRETLAALERQYPGWNARGEYVGV
jgi:hypothetical protein